MDDELAEDLEDYSLYAIEVSGSEIASLDSTMSYDDAEQVTKSRTSYFIADSESHYYDDDVTIYDATNGGAEASVSTNDWVVYAEEDGLVVCVYIVD